MFIILIDCPGGAEKPCNGHGECKVSFPKNM